VERFRRAGAALRSIPMATAGRDLRHVLDRSDLLLDAAIAAGVFAASLALLAIGENEAGESVDAVGVLLVALTALPLLVRRRAPVAAFALAALASIALRLAADPAGPPLAATLALYLMVATSEESRTRTRLLLALVVAALAAHVAASGIATGRFPDNELLFGTLLWTAVWIAGDRTRMRRERMAALEERALRAEREAERERRLAAAEERTRIARDLHDSAGHAINTILVHAGLGRLRSDAATPEAREAFATIEDVARETVGEIDQMVRALRDDTSAPDEVEAPPGLAALDALIGRHRAAGMDVTATVSGELPALPPPVDRGVYRIIQEALTNAARHGGGSVHVEIAAADGELSLVVENPLNPAGRPAPGGGHGIAGMRERAALLGGTLEALPTGTRFRVRAEIPLGDGRR
jgi:signal transduction histidine kinase